MTVHEYIQNSLKNRRRYAVTTKPKLESWTTLRNLQFAEFRRHLEEELKSSHLRALVLYIRGKKRQNQRHHYR